MLAPLATSPSPPFVMPTPKPGPYPHGSDSQRQPNVPRGTVTPYEWKSEIFPGTRRAMWIYVPAQYADATPANVMVFQDGGSYVQEDGHLRVPIVFDNLIHQDKMPVTIAVLINPGEFPAASEGKPPI